MKLWIALALGLSLSACGAVLEGFGNLDVEPIEQTAYV